PRPGTAEPGSTPPAHAATASARSAAAAPPLQEYRFTVSRPSITESLRCYRIPAWLPGSLRLSVTSARGNESPRSLPLLPRIEQFADPVPELLQVRLGRPVRRAGERTPDLGIQVDQLGAEERLRLVGHRDPRPAGRRAPRPRRRVELALDLGEVGVL